MVGQINDTARLHGDGKTLQVTGWLQFEADEKSTVVVVTVTQDDGALTVTGPSGNTPSIKKAWAAEVDGDDTFHAGTANAKATATVYLRDGTQEQYPEEGQDPWEKIITLVP
jgi:hypothetical protein